MRYRVLLLLWLLTDLLVFIGSYALAYGMRVGWILSSDFPLKEFLLIVAIVAPVWLLVLFTTRVFALTRNQANLRNFAYIAYACLMGAAFTALAYFFAFERFFSRLLIVEGFIISAILTFVWHIIFEQILRSIVTKDPPAFPTLIIGLTRESRALIKTLKEKKSPLSPIGIIVPEGTSEQLIEGVPMLGKLPKLEEALTKLGVTHVVQASDLEQSLNILGMCRSHGIHYLLLPSVLGMVERDERVESLEGMPVVQVSPTKGGWSWFVE